MADVTHAAFTDQKDAESYQAAKDRAAGLPRIEGVPSGEDPAGWRHFYPAQRVTETLERVTRAADGKAFAVTVNPAIDPGPKAALCDLTDPKWRASVDAAAAGVAPELADERKP
jgi:hypothetical protein